MCGEKVFFDVLSFAFWVVKWVNFRTSFLCIYVSVS
jgi:hypothetical protein